MKHLTIKDLTRLLSKNVLSGYSIFSAIAFLLIALSSCSDEGPNGGEKIESGRYSLSGKVEKGPFVRGSSVSIQPLDESMAPFGTIFNGEIQDNSGSFNLGTMELASQYVRIASDGYYFNEVSGQLSSGTLHLVALADLSDKSTVNVNILTHLKAARVQNLVASGMKYSDANKQAQKELLSQFGLQAYENTSAEDLSIASGNDGAGVLIAISSLILVDRSDASVTEYLSYLSEDLADDGAFDEYSMRSISGDRLKLRNELDNIALNIVNRYEEMSMRVEVPDLRYYFDWNGDGIAGNEINDNVEITLSSREVIFEKQGGTVEISVNSNIQLSLEPFKDPYGDNGPISSDSFFKQNFFESSGSPMKLKTSFDGSKLTITCDKTEYHSAQTSTVYLYDLMGYPVAEVKVYLAGDPDIEQKLSSFGEQIIGAELERFAIAMCQNYYLERGYTGMSEFYNVRCPFSPSSNENREAYSAAYQFLNFSNQIISNLEQNGDKDATPFFRLLNAIVYSEIADKWGNTCILNGGDIEPNLNPVQLSAIEILKYADNELCEIQEFLTNKNKSDGYFTSAERIFDIPRDIYLAASGISEMQLGHYFEAEMLLSRLVEESHYSLSEGDEDELNSGTILLIDVPYSLASRYPGIAGHKVPIFSYADALLCQAECEYFQGRTSHAASIVANVARKKGISISGNVISDIETIRKALFLPRYFAFQKRNNLGNYLDYQYLWPIPSSQIDTVSGWRQNPGY